VVIIVLDGEAVSRTSHLDEKDIDFYFFALREGPGKIPAVAQVLVVIFIDPTLTASDTESHLLTGYFTPSFATNNRHS
jgi:hypothetical protein